MYRVKLLCLVLGNLQHLQAENSEIVFLKLFNNISDRILTNCIGFDDGEGALQGFHV